MKTLVILVGCILPIVLAKPQQYGAPIGLGNNGGNFNDQSGGSSGPSSSQSDGPKVYKHISIHVPPAEEFETPMKRIVRPMSNSDKVVNIIFVKAPSQSSSQQTEVILPSQPESKTVVYILVKRPEGQSDVKIRQPAPTRPPRPEVFFIRYNKGAASSAVAGGSSSSSSSATAPVAPSQPEYGVPA